MSEDLGYLVHSTIQGDRWDLLAHRYYGDASKMTVILDANRALFVDPLEVPPLILPPGLSLIVPVIEEEEVDRALLPPWKQGGA